MALKSTTYFCRNDFVHMTKNKCQIHFVNLHGQFDPLANIINRIKARILCCLVKMTVERFTRRLLQFKNCKIFSDTDKETGNCH